ncbi:hypothetical protein PGT21_000462 [Puccinia graminis f. sp. tritici]|uniref:Uncharacterized protein n=2 Tax=Puccinia graminis f. sp. tritici TaxID=56615 RepID=A0A5B0NH70_PUCGR|nr:hypothetical protein PGT21_000981 [Puccinia graminis f. sp. tritici]KAA1088577.1 hypothetical protein PGT21_000462 [Puccinia graminis f. sp. tritici]
MPYAGIGVTESNDNSNPGIGVTESNDNSNPGIGVTESNNNSNPCHGLPLPETDTSITNLATDVNLPSELPVAVASIEESRNLERAADILPLIPEEDTTEVLMWVSRDSMNPSADRKHLITRRELKQLRHNKYLNDVLIEYGLALELARLRNTNPEVHNNTLLFSTFFFSKLKQQK